MTKWLTNNLWRHTLAIFVSLFSLFPLYLVIISSLNPSGSLNLTSFIPTEISFDNFHLLFNDPRIPYLTWMRNSLIIAGAVAVLSVTIDAAPIVTERTAPHSSSLQQLPVSL